MIKVYGIKNCNTVKKALDWLNQNNVSYEFHDYKKKGITQEKLEEWCNYFGWENVLNKKGTTWKGLNDEDKNKVKDQQTAIKLMIEKPSVIKRPVIEAGGKQLISFNEEEFEHALKMKS